MAGVTNTYSFQTEGVVLIGATTLDNVISANVEWEGDVETSERLAAGDTAPLTVTGMNNTLTATLTLELYDESGVAADLNGFLVNDSTGVSQTIKLRPYGTAATKKELILTGMRLESKSKSYETGTGFPAVQGSMTWTGAFTEEVAETAQPS